MVGFTVALVAIAILAEIGLYAVEIWDGISIYIILCLIIFGVFIWIVVRGTGVQEIMIAGVAAFAIVYALYVTAYCESLFALFLSLMYGLLILAAFSLFILGNPEFQTM